MNFKIPFFLLASLLTSIFIQAQDNSKNTQEKLFKNISEYYEMDRENIHLHLNKSTYLTGEGIWFKGYIIEKKNKLPFANTSNVYVKLLDQNGLEVDSKLLAAENSTFEGQFKLDLNLKSGTYYLQSYTNYMNNFFEDESNISKIEIINADDEKYISPKKVNLNAINITFFVEGETFLEGVKNIITLKAEDCNGNGVIINDAEISDDTNAALTTFSTDQFGFGKFEINNTKNTQYKLLYVLNEKKIIKNIPNVVLNGYTLQVNNYSLVG